MASVNGVLSLPSDSDLASAALTLSAKRKREDSIEGQNHINGISDSNDSVTAEDTTRMITDLIDILRSHDTSPSILSRTLPPRTPSAEPQAKRQKSETGSEPTTILSRAASNAYTSVDEALGDIDTAVNDIIEKLELADSTTRIQYSTVDPEKNELSLRIQAFKQRAHELIQKERAINTIIAGAAENLTSYNANSSAGSKLLTNVSSKIGDTKLALTLYGNAPQPKQLFSSLQQPTKVPGENQMVVQALQEAGLPPGLSTTQIVPIQSISITEEKKRVQTLGELFPTPTTVPSLQPPKPSKIATTRSSIVGWYQPSTADPSPKKSGYSSQPISTGHWLDYANASPPQNSTKKKPRDRAMSLGGSKAPQVDPEPAESEAAKLDALFRSAYSGFAPTKDDAAAIVPEGVINRIWWHRIGEKSFERLVENTNKLDEVTTTESDDAGAGIGEADEDEKFREAVEWYEAQKIDPSLEVGAEKSAEEKDVEEVLEGISELLETLNSYQRIRHMSLNTRPAGLLSTMDTSALGTPAKPSDSEMATYEILKTQLSLMIGSLPPFAVAKLNSNQLAELSISTKIPIEVENYKGVMEEDEVSAKAKAAALSSASTSRINQPASLPRASSTALYGNQYARQAAPVSQQYYGSQTPARQPVANFQRPPSTTPAPFPAQRSAAAPYRPASYGTPTYPHQNPRPIQQQFTQQTQNYLSTPPTQGYARPVGQSYQAPQSAPQVPMNARYPQGSYPQQALNQNGLDYRYNNGANNGRQSSPQKSIYSPQSASAQIQGRPGYSTPTPSMAANPRAPSYIQNQIAQLANGHPSQSPQPHVPQQSLTNYSTFMSAEQQSNMMERQRAQLAQQQAGTQQQARQMAQAAMGSPSKINGNPVPAGL